MRKRQYALTAFTTLAFVVWIAGCNRGPKTYQSVGIIEIDPRITTPELTDRIMPLWQAKVVSVIKDLQSDRVAHEAMNSPEWKTHRKNPPDTYLKEWKRNLVVKLTPNSFDITVTYTDDSADAKDIVQIAVKSTIDAYLKLFGDDQDSDSHKKKTKQQREEEILDEKIAACEIQIGQLLHVDGEELHKVFDAKFVAHVELEKKLHEMQAALSQNNAELEKPRHPAQTRPYTVEEFARVDPVMAEMHQLRTQTDLEYQDYVKRFGVEHPATKAAKKRLHVRDDDLKRHAAELNSKFYSKSKIDGSGTRMAPTDLSAPEMAAAQAQELLDKQKVELDDLNDRVHKVSILRSEKTRLEGERREVRNKIEELAQEIDMANNVKVVDPGGPAQLVPAGASAGSK